MSITNSTSSFGVALAAGVTLLARASVLLAGATPLLAQDLFWTDASSTGSIRRMHRDGSVIQTLPIAVSGGRGLAIDAVHDRMYWFNAGTNEIRWAHLDGTGQAAVVPNVHESYGVAIDSVHGKIYWCSADQNGPADSIWCANLDGTSPAPLATPPASLFEPMGIAVDPIDGWLFWSDIGNSTISRARLDGHTDWTVIVPSTGGAVYPLTLDLDRGYLYWGVIPQAGAANGSIVRSHIDGSHVATLFSSIESPGAIVLEPDENSIVWTETYDLHAPQIVRGNLTTHLSSVVTTGQGVPWGLARLGGDDCGPGANTLTHYRFESGVDNQVATGTSSVPSSFGSGLPGTPLNGPHYRSTVFGPSVPQTGATNDLCMEFDGVDDAVVFAEPFVFSRALPEATFEMWFKLPDQPHAAIVWGDPNLPQDAQRFHLYTIPGGGIAMDYSNGSLQTILPAGYFNVTANQWTHFAATRVRLPNGNDSYSFYKNGILVYSMSYPSSVLPTGQVWSIGGRSTNPLLGAVDEVRCSDRVLDPSEFLDAPFRDVDANGVPDDCECMVTNYCIAGINSLGQGAHMDHGGAPSLGLGSMSIQCVGCPPNATGLFFYGPVQAQEVFGNGYRCVGGPIRRLGVTTASAMGTAAYTLAYSQLLPGATIHAGSTWNFQFWYRNAAGGGAGFNLSDGLSIRFCP